MLRRAHWLTVVAALTAWCGGAGAAEQNFTDFDLATLMRMDVIVTSAARRAQEAEDAAAAVFVITREDIRRSGATSIPEVLRFAPGLQVARINTRTWAVTSRGFNRQFANKLQVLVDGRSIYAMVFSGVMWEEQLIPIEQVERIEVVRGPGGALWGINAVNGVINIITRAASADEGMHLTAGAGTYMSEAAALHYGARTDAGDLHLYVDHNDADAFDGDTNDVNRTQVGVKFERVVGLDHYTARGEYADADFGDSHVMGDSALPPSAHVGNIGVGWRRDHASSALSSASTYYAWSDRGEPGGWDEATLGFDVQHTAARRGRHLATLGAGFRYVSDKQGDADAASAFSKPSLNHEQWSIYLQDEIFWFNDRLRVIAGAKAEHFKYPGFEVQPTLRALWRAEERHTFWAAASRAARSPARFELHSAIDAPLPSEGVPMTLSITGDEQLAAERLDAYEFGWRWRPDARFSFDLALFRHEYDDLIVERQLEPVFAPGPPPSLRIPLVYENAAKATGQGVEIAAEWLATDRLRFMASAHQLDLDLPVITNSLNGLGGDPDQSWSLRMRFDVSESLELDAAFRAVNEIGSQNVSAYESVDVRLGYWPTKDLGVSLSIENLLDDEHAEFFDEVSQSAGATLGRSVFARVTWRTGR